MKNYLYSHNKIPEVISELNDAYKLFNQFFLSYGRYPRIREWHNLYKKEILNCWVDNNIDFNLPNDLFNEVDFKERIYLNQNKLNYFLNTKISYIYETLKYYDDLRYESDESYMKYIGIRALLLTISAFFNKTNLDFDSCLVNTIKAEVDSSPGYYRDQMFNIKLSSLMNFDYIADHMSLDLLVFDYSPCLLKRCNKNEKYLINYANKESKIVSQDISENIICKNISEDFKFIISTLNDKEATLLINRYGLDNSPNKLFIDIKNDLNYESYSEILLILNNAFWKLKSIWPIDFISAYFFNRNSEYTGISI